MRRVLIVANQTLGGAELQREIRQRADAEPCTFWVLVPATDAAHPELLTPHGFLGATASATALGSSERGVGIAEARLEAELDRLRANGVRATGVVGDPDPMQAITEALGTREFDEILIATLPSGVSRWLRQDLVHRARRRFGLPLAHVVSHERAGAPVR